MVCFWPVETPAIFFGSFQPFPGLLLPAGNIFTQLHLVFQPPGKST
jgi:hypothetical protein